MKRETMNIKDHICPSCGGTLRVDIARQMYECPFCGMTFDYDYFREENVLELADRALIAGEIYSAKQAYEFMLTKEPDNFVALRGMSLIDMKMAGVEKLKDVDNYRKVSYLAASNSLDKAIEVCKPENKEYFVLMKDMLSAGHEYFSEDKLIQKEREERSKLSDKLNETIKKRDEICKGENGNPIDSSEIIALCTAWLVLWCLMSTVIFAVVRTSNPYSEENYKNRRDNSSRVVHTVQVNDSDYPSVGDIQSLYEYTRDMDPDEAREEINRYVIEAHSSENRRDREEAEKEREEEREREQDKEERERRNNEADWEEAHKKDIPIFAAVIAIPAAIVGLVALRLKRRDKKYNDSINEIKKTIEGHSAKIRRHEEHKTELKDRIAAAYKDLRSFDPVI